MGERDVSPMDRRRYPANWEAIRRAVLERSGHRCECLGECGIPHEPRCDELDGKPAKQAKGKVVLTIAHLDHDPEACRDSARLRAMCQRCHLRYDQDHHAETRRRSRA